MSILRQFLDGHDYFNHPFHLQQISAVLIQLGIDDENKAAFLDDLIGDGGKPFPVSLIGNENYIFRTIIDRLPGNQGIPVSDDERDRLLKSIQSGELFRNVAFIIATLFKFAENPNKFEVPHVENLVENLPPATLADIDALFVEIKNVKAGEKIIDPQLLNHTLRLVYRSPIIGNSVDTANLLFSGKNTTLRLALIIYARLYGVNINELDIDEVRRTLLDRAKPNLGELLSYAVNNKERMFKDTLG